MLALVAAVDGRVNICCIRAERAVVYILMSAHRPYRTPPSPARRINSAAPAHIPYPARVFRERHTQKKWAAQHQFVSLLYFFFSFHSFHKVYQTKSDTPAPHPPDVTALKRTEVSAAFVSISTTHQLMRMARRKRREKDSVKRGRVG